MYTRELVKDEDLLPEALVVVERMENFIKSGCSLEYRLDDGAVYVPIAFRLFREVNVAARKDYIDCMTEMRRAVAQRLMVLIGLKVGDSLHGLFLTGIVEGTPDHMRHCMHEELTMMTSQYHADLDDDDSVLLSFLEIENEELYSTPMKAMNRLMSLCFWLAHIHADRIRILESHD
jgi:hypothetical protein